MKKGIALFSTLMILVLVIMLMSVALKNSTNIKISTLKDRYIIQENITVTDLIKLIEEKIVPKFKLFKGENRVIVQEVLFKNPITINDKVTNSTITVKLIPNDGKININYINSIEGKKYIKKIFTAIGVQEPEILANIILANITNSNKYSDDYKLHIKEKNIQAGTTIKDKKIFDYILDLYVQNTTDNEVYTIDFSKYFNFYQNIEEKYNRISGKSIDINYAEIELIDSLGVSLGNDVRKTIRNKTKTFYNYDQLKLEDASKHKDILIDNGFGFKTKNILLEINTESINNRVKYLLNYNLETKKISNISMDRWIY